MIRIFLNGLGASAGAGLTYLYNVVPQLARTPGVHTTIAISQELRSQFKASQTMGFAEVPKFRSALSRFLFEQVKLPNVIRKSSADVLMSPGNFALRNSPVPQILLSGNSLYTSADFDQDLLRRREYRMLLETHLRAFFAKKSIHWADRTVAPSFAFAEQLTAWCKAPIDTVYHGFSHKSFFQDESRLPEHIEQKLKQNGNALRLLFVSHYNYYRNFETLLRAIPLICARLPGVRVRLFLTCNLRDEKTPGSYRTGEASALITHLGIRDEVVELGAVPYEQLHHLYRACDVYVTAAYTETFAHPLVEAMASGLPIVASDLAVHREVARDSALYFDRFSPEKLAESVEHLAPNDELRSKLSFLGKQRSLDFSWSNHVNELLGIADRLAFPNGMSAQRMSA